jgi:hypothetical protein
MHRFTVNGLEGIAVSDAESAKLKVLADLVRNAQAAAPNPAATEPAK